MSSVLSVVFQNPFQKIIKSFTKFVPFASFVEFVIKSAPVDHEWHELYESHECPTDVDDELQFNLKRVQ